MKSICFGCCLALLTVAVALAQSNPVPLIYQPSVPTAVAPGGAGFTLTVNGTGFVSGATINWNGSPRPTTFVSKSQLTATIGASDIATASTALITVSNPAPGGGASNTLSLPISLPISPILFSQGTSNYAYSGIGGLAAGDFNQDGNFDLFVPGYGGPNYAPGFSIFLGNGNGTLSGLTGYPTAGYTYLAVVGDFNNDGKLDVVTASCGADDTCASGGFVVVALGNGDGSFQPAIQSAAGPRLNSFSAADLNGDGNLDVVATCEQNDFVYVLLGNGGGTFQPPVTYSTQDFPLNPVIADFNRDGILDIAVTNFYGSSCCSSGSVSILLGNGDGTFQKHVDYPTDPNPFSSVAADFNGDGKLDLAFLEVGDYNLGVLLGNGDGTFQPVADYSIGKAPSALDLADINSDGHLDLTVTSYNGTVTGILSIFLGNEDGSFQTPLAYTTPNSPYTLLWRDFNHDGRLDLAAIAEDPSFNRYIWLSLQTTLEVSPLELTFPTQAVGFPGPPAFITLTNHGTASINMNSASLSGINERDFSFVNLCGKSLAAGQSCTFRIVFTPGAQGFRSATLAINDSAAGSPQLIALSESALTPMILLTPASVTFSTQLVGTASSIQKVQVYNSGNFDVDFTSIMVSGEFAVDSNCGTSLRARHVCTIDVKFLPKGLGVRSGTVTIADDVVGSPQTIPLTGTGTDFMLSPTSLDFGNVSIGTTSNPKTVTLTNEGVNTQTIYSIGLAGMNPMQFALTNNCPSSLGVGQSCTMLITFSPTGFGTKSATLQVGGGGGTEVVTLSGSGT